MHVRQAAPADAPASQAIYAHYVRTTAVTFATHAPTAEAYAAQMADRRYPFLVAEAEGQVAGFIYAAPFREKEAYRWDVALTIYLAPGFEGRGLGWALMDPPALPGEPQPLTDALLGQSPAEGTQKGSRV